MLTNPISVSYLGPQSEEADNEIRGIFEAKGYNLIGTGYDLIHGRRDLEFKHASTMKTEGESSTDVPLPEVPSAPTDVPVPENPLGKIPTEAPSNTP